MAGIDRDGLIDLFVGCDGTRVGDLCINNKGWRVNRNVFPKATDITGDFFPARNHIFRALERLSPSEVKYLVLGQDPYPSARTMENGGKTPNAIGIAFIVDSNDPKDFPASLKPFIGTLLPKHGQTRPTFLEWVDKSPILLLNAALTVPQLGDDQNVRAVAGDHLPYWRNFTASIIANVRLANHEAQLIAIGSKPREVLCDGLEKAGCFSSCRHPTASTGNLQSFNDFWEQNKIGAELKLLAGN